MEDRVALTASEVQQSESEVASPALDGMSPEMTLSWRWDPVRGLRTQQPTYGLTEASRAARSGAECKLGVFSHFSAPCSTWGVQASFSAMKKIHIVTTSHPMSRVQTQAEKLGQQGSHLDLAEGSPEPDCRAGAWGRKIPQQCTGPGQACVDRAADSRGLQCPSPWSPVKKRGLHPGYGDNQCLYPHQPVVASAQGREV